MIVQVCLRPTPVRLEEAVSAVPRNEHRSVRAPIARACSVSEGRPTTRYSGGLVQAILSEPQIEAVNSHPEHRFDWLGDRIIGGDSP
jgi:hypothetical protein